ncbi:hypothetical protein BCD49_06180 [Pseudofrankia sp. EUN1h]|nr:hypothetical protein BCD49_06180 [Pseudofrankia sp. EUN1h]
MADDLRFDGSLPRRPDTHGAVGVAVLARRLPVQLDLLPGMQAAVAADQQVAELGPATAGGLR